MKLLDTTARVLYGTGIAAVGIHQIILKGFRPEVLPPFPAWAHAYIALPILVGIGLLFAGIVISGVVGKNVFNVRRICLYLGLYFLVVAFFCHLPYILFISSFAITRLDVWFGFGEALAYGGGAFIMAGLLSANDNMARSKSSIELLLEKMIPYGRVLFCVLMLMFGWSHFVFTGFVSLMVPKWMGLAKFWTLFVGVALIGSAIAIIFKIWIRPIALLLALMLFLFFLFFHVPDAIANPRMGSGNEIVRAIIALLFCGIALGIASLYDGRSKR